MAQLERPKPLRSPAVDDKYTLTPISEKIVEFVRYVQASCNGPGKEREKSRNHAKFLVRDLQELKKETSLPSRSTAVIKLYENFAEWVKLLPEEATEAEGMKNGDHPKSVVLKGMTKCPSGCDGDYHATLIKALKNPKSFNYIKSTRSWEPHLGNQTGHADGKTWKAYVDAADGKGTKWRMGFGMAFEEVDSELTVTINYCKIGH